ncbi:hypothetical protein B0H15DRAFT_986391 [Mycena belliarum]|uniref:Uncharacterized protein n=1 Tax=Mycena belliarum TaxID=1033014 RepID=A0AAD6XRA0_9AGAR|nr:hypothetical protein B0H15DRAFT_986391 [Mycena belliae]
MGRRSLLAACARTTIEPTEHLSRRWAPSVHRRRTRAKSRHRSRAHSGCTSCVPTSVPRPPSRPGAEPRAVDDVVEHPAQLFGRRRRAESLRAMYPGRATVPMQGAHANRRAWHDSTCAPASRADSPGTQTPRQMPGRANAASRVGLYGHVANPGITDPFECSRAPVEEPEGDADPLDSIGGTPDVAVVEVVATKSRARSRSVKAPVKEEEDELTVPARGWRAKKAVAPVAPKARATRKGAVPAIEAVEKEKTPEYCAHKRKRPQNRYLTESQLHKT